MHKIVLESWNSSDYELTSITKALNKSRFKLELSPEKGISKVKNKDSKKIQKKKKKNAKQCLVNKKDYLKLRSDRIKLCAKHHQMIK